MNKWTPETIRARLLSLQGEDAHAPAEEHDARTRLLDAATAHFARFGYRRANVGDIAREAGISKGAVYLHFKSKHQLLLACVAREKMALLPEIERILELPPAHRLEAYLRVALTFAFSAPLSGALARGDHELKAIMAGMDKRERASDEERGLGFLTGLIDPAFGLSVAQRDAVARMMAGVLSLPVHLEDEERRFGLPIDTFIDTYASVLARGIAALGEGT